MPRLRRTLAVGSWALLALVAVLWPLSNTRGRDGAGLAVGVRLAPAFSRRPGFHLILGIIESNSRAEVWYFTGAVPCLGALDCVAGREGAGLLGVRLIAYAPNAGDWYFGLALPFWLLAPLAVGGIRAGRRVTRRPAHLCRHCGYDLRATPDPAGPSVERCPECGREREG